MVYKMPLLQVALDVLCLEEALKIARLCVEGGIDILEAGTPLIKEEGLRAVSLLKSLFPEKIVVADTKTMDAGALEAKAAFNVGADVVTVMALAGVETIREVVETAKDMGGKVMVDMMNVDKVVEKAVEIYEKCGPDLICLHVGVDVQKRRGIDVSVLIEEAEKIRKTIPVKVAVAGGINAKTAQLFAEKDIDVLVVGKAITGSQDPKAATIEILKSMGRI